MRQAGLSRPTDLLFPPERLFNPAWGFQTGLHHVFELVYSQQQNRVVAAYVFAQREQDICLIDVRATPDAPGEWVEHMITSWETIATNCKADSMVGPVGCFAFLADGVSEDYIINSETIHIPAYPNILVACLRRRGYVSAWSGTVWGRQGAYGTPQVDVQQRISSVRTGSWMNIFSIALKLERVLSASFATLPWHRGSGAPLPSLVRSYAPVFDPSLVMLGGTLKDPSGAVLTHHELSSVPQSAYALPRFLQRLWLWRRSRQSGSLHVSVIGLLPRSRNSRTGFALFKATEQLLRSATLVTTSVIRDDNDASRLMAQRMGLSPLQQRIVFRKQCQQCSTTIGE